MSIKIENISVSFDEKKVLDRFSLDVPDRGIICLFGPSGSGKTTVLNVIAGIVKTQDGNVSGLSGKRASYVFQDERLLKSETALKNVSVVMAKGQDERAKEILRASGLSDDMLLYPDEMSGGMRRRVCIARALVFDADILLLDEPLVGLDDDIKNKIMPLILEKTGRIPAVLVTHDHEDALRMADEIYVVSGPPMKIISVIKLPEELKMCSRSDSAFIKYKERLLGGSDI